MAPTAKETGGSDRRRSMKLFSRATLPSPTQINTEIANGTTEDGGTMEKKKLTKRSTMFGLGPSASPDLLPDKDSLISPRNGEASGSPNLRPRTLQKGRPTSFFGSLGKRSLNEVDREELDGLAEPAHLSPGEEGHPLEQRPSMSKTVLHHGEVQTTSGLFRKKKEYLVLTDTHLIRFKSQWRASETFSSIPPAYGRSNATRHPSTTSIGSLHEGQSITSHSSADNDNRIPLSQIVTAYKVEDGRPFFTTEVVYLDEENHAVGSIQLMLHDPKEADLWHTCIRGAAQKARLIMEEPYPQRVIRYLVQVLEGADDYDANHFQVFRVVRRAAVPRNGRSSADDLQKLSSAVFYMVIGINRLHMIPLPDFNGLSGYNVTPKATRTMHGLVTLVSMSINTHYTDDRFELGFRVPLHPVKVLELAASATPDIAVAIFRACQSLKPQWLDYNFHFIGPRGLLESAEKGVVHVDEEYGGFDRTLVAYCTAYSCNPMNIQYGVDWDVEDAPEFRLFCPASTQKYSVYELLAIMRALRYNESFKSISFRDIDLHCIHGLRDIHGTDHVSWTTRTGISIQKYFNMKPQERSLLYQEVQGLALKSKKLRRMDFTNSLPKRQPRDTFDTEGGEIEKDPGCEIVAALLPLCRGQLTNVDWIVLSGIQLGETDLDDLIPALNEIKSRIRAIECSHSALNDRGIMQLLSHLERQNGTLECVNLSDNPGRIHVERFQVSMSRFDKIRKLDLSRITRTSGDEALVAPEVMLSWRLEELIINGIPINDKTLDSISTYLASDMSANLHMLQMDQCGLNGTHVALLMRAMNRKPGEARDVQLHVSANRLEKGVGEFVSAIEENLTPSQLVVRMIEFTKEDHFKQLLQALRTNTTIRSLDISKASLPYDAGPETCDTLRLVFAENTTLEELDISGEQAHLEVTRFGIGLNHALTGLKGNKTLKVLRIEYQNLGLEGANTLSSVIEENTGLTHIYCEHNDINLQGFTILVNAVAKNYTLLDLPFMYDDQGESIKRISASMRDSRRNAIAGRNDGHRKSSILRSLSSFGTSKPGKPDITPQDVDAVVRLLGERWETETQRLAMFLERNRNIAAGVHGSNPYAEAIVSNEALRPTTAMSDNGILDHVLSATTPKVELGNPVDDVRVVSNFANLEFAGNDKDLKSGAELSDGVEKKGGGRLELLPELPRIKHEKFFDL